MDYSILSVIPPPILQYYNSYLLKCPGPGLHSRKYYEDRFLKAARKKLGKRKMTEFYELLEICEKLYEWKTAQEAYNKTENQDLSKKPSIPFEAINRIRGRLGKNIRDAFSHFKS